MDQQPKLLGINSADTCSFPEGINEHIRMSGEKEDVIVEQIGRYRIKGELGRGGMGVVFRGEDPLIGREVAIKTLTEATPELRERFYLEARSGILSHPNIVTVYELGEENGNPFIAMELIAGESLEKILRGGKRLPLLEVLPIVEQLCSGLGYAHSRGVVHRDIKPANILVQPDGRVTIVDFGIARLADQTRYLTKTDALLGSFHYIAPERLKGEAADGRADLWSVGVILYEMLSGALPFQGKDISSLYRVIHEPYTPLQEYGLEPPPGVISILDRALAKKVEDRYATAEQLVLDVQRLSVSLKEQHLKTLLDSARRLMAERQFIGARAILQQAQRLDPGNLEISSLQEEIQEHANQLQRSEQLHQWIEQGQAALDNRRWEEAIGFFLQAQKLDIDNAFDIAQRLEEIQQKRQQHQKISALWEQANDARSRGDLTKAQECLAQALQLNENSTDLKNAHSVILREIRRKQQLQQVEDLLGSAKENYSSRRYTEAITCLRKAAEIDSNHAEVQQLLFTATTRQREEKRQELLEKISAEIHDSIDREEFDLAADRVKRALETLPGEGMLLGLQVEIEARRRRFFEQQLVRELMLKAQELFAESPAEALQVIEDGLEKAPENESLLQLRERLTEHLRKVDAEQARTSALAQVQVALANKSYSDAKRILQEFITSHGSSEEIEKLLAIVLREEAQAERQKRASQETRPSLVDEAAELHPEASKERPSQGASSDRSKAQKHSRKRFQYAAIVAVAVTVVAIMIGAFIIHRRTAIHPSVSVAPAVSSPPVSLPVKSDLEINAIPWGRVVEIRDSQGKLVALSNDDRTTPLRLEGLEEGKYTVALSAPTGQTQTLECNLTEENHLCSAELGSLDISRILKGASQ